MCVSNVRRAFGEKERGAGTVGKCVGQSGGS